ncbi:MAG: 4-hydroxy-tetrahydrodipicolinate synthase [Wenzhouxiangellaceae bacterium]|nr:4-hydroxy-tetrahydrodipicolinate synthase [Wenzhouxiangellaceae bacterium]
MNENFPTGSIVAMVTPMADDQRVDEPSWTRLLEWQLDSGSDGIVVAGTTGESATLDDFERDLLLESALETANGRCAVIAGTGSASTAVAIAQSRRAAALGAQWVLVVTPYYNRPPQRGLEMHYRAIADACPVPLILYNVPSRTAVDLQVETALRLAEHPNIVAVKEALPDMQRVRSYADAGLAVLSGDDPSALEAIRHGARGVISVAANIAPIRFGQMCRSALSAQEDERAGRLNAELEPLYRFLALDSNPIPAKWLLLAMGRIKAGIRLPLVPLSNNLHPAGRELIDSLDLKTLDRN